MQSKKLLASALLALTACTASVTATAQDVLNGDTRLACEAILCLASGTRPTECASSLQKYFSISFRRFSDTIRGRVNFLKLCPTSSQTPEMQSLVSALANGAGRCDAESLNRTMRRMMRSAENQYIYISSRLPDYCSAYIGNQYSNLGGLTPKYVGTEENDGYWVAGSDYDAALTSYNERMAVERREYRNNR